MASLNIRLNIIQWELCVMNPCVTIRIPLNQLHTGYQWNTYMWLYILPYDNPLFTMHGWYAVIKIIVRKLAKNKKKPLLNYRKENPWAITNSRNFLNAHQVHRRICVRRVASPQGNIFARDNRDITYKIQRLSSHGIFRKGVMWRKHTF